MITVVLIGVVSLFVVLAPFFVGSGGQLMASTAFNDLDKLEGFKSSILKRYVEEEKAFNDELISASAWKKRQGILANRYLDVVRRIDFVKEVSKND